jgi:CheY-like chemotaxis protein
VVDDDPTVRELVVRHLERAGFAVVAARGGQEGLRLVRELRPAAVTLDIMMPDLDGWTVLAAIKGDPALANVPVVLMSIIEEKNRGYALGAADYLVKPVDRTNYHRRPARRDHPRPDDAGDGRVRVYGRTARAAGLAGHSGRGHHR